MVIFKVYIGAIVGKSRNSRGDKEYSRLQELAHENKSLKKQVASLRKQLARIDLDRYASVKDTIQRSYQLEEELEGKKILAKVKKEWKCNNCTSGHLEICLYNRPDGTHYFRKCDNCPHRTKSQRYTNEVVGVIKENK